MIRDEGATLKAEATAPGLCGTCRRAERIATSKGALFYLCRRSYTDPHYPRYPTLPVLRCAGFEPDDTVTGDR
jgi:hypothetical protein